MEYTTLRGVPIFRTGWHHGQYYSPARLRRIVKNSNTLRPKFAARLKVKLTHHDLLQPELLHFAALGQATRFYLKQGKGGPFVMADFTGVPKPVSDVAPHHFPDVSVEKYRELVIDGERFPDVIKAVAFLGADAPEVKGLKLAYPEIFDAGQGVVDVFQMGGGTSMIGETIKQKREELGMSPEDLAGVLNVEPEVIAQWEAGEVEPDENQLQALADALGISLEELTGNKPPENDKKPGDKPAAKPDKKEEPAMFSDGDVNRIVESALARQARALNAKIDALARKYQRTETELFQERQAAKREHIQAKIQEWRKAGMPAVMERMGLETFMEKLGDGQQALELFDENGKPAPEKPLEWFERWVEKFQEVGMVDSRELSGEDYDPTLRDDPNGLIEHYAEQHSITYADAARELSRQGKLTV